MVFGGAARENVLVWGFESCFFLFISVKVVSHIDVNVHLCPFSTVLLTFLLFVLTL